MVVNRKQPAIPVPAAVSRSSSSQAVPTKRTKNATKSVLANGITKPPEAKVVKKPKQKKRSLLDRLFLFALSLFACYTVYTCRPNPLFSSPAPETPLCRSLSTYHHAFLQPYVIPPLQHSLSYAHSLAEPYIAHTTTTLEPYAAPVLALKPYALHSLSAAKRLWSGTLVPLYTNTLQPYWTSAVVPRYRKHLRPHIIPLTAKAERYYVFYIANPVRIHVARAQAHVYSAYATHLAPHVRHAQPYVQTTLTTTYGGAVRAVELYTTHVHPQLVNGWHAARPHLCTAWKYGKKGSVLAADVGAKQLRRAAKEAGGLRRTYVDPHVIKIWDKVAPEGSAPSSASSPLTTAAKTPAQETPEVVDAPVPPPIVSPTPADTVVEATPEPEETAPAPVEEPSAVVEATPEPTPLSEEEEQDQDQDQESLNEQEQEEQDQESKEDDLDSFLRDLDSPETPASPEPASEPTISISITPSTPAEEDPEAVARTAQRRLDITTRHEAWFAKVRDAIVRETEELPGKFVESRGGKVRELEGAMRGEKGKGQGKLDDVQRDAEKLLKGLEAYLGKAEARSAAWKVVPSFSSSFEGTQEEKINAFKKEVEAKKAAAGLERDKWTVVLGRVEDRFAERVRKLQGEVHEWYLEVRRGESDMVDASVATIKHLAERGQADIGLDYAWLPDVTYQDWESYHALLSLADEYMHTAWSIQNGTHPTHAPTAEHTLGGSVERVLDVLDGELGDVVQGWGVALGKVKGEAGRVFGVHVGGKEEEGGFWVGRDGEMKNVEEAGVGANEDVKEKEEEGEVHILPIDASPPLPEIEEPKEEAFDASKVVLGKDKVQIEQALRDVPLEPVPPPAVVHEKHEEL